MHCKKRKTRDAPQNEEAAQMKSEAIHWSYVGAYIISVFLYRRELKWKVGETKLNEIILNSTKNSWSKQPYIQGFDWENIVFLKAINMFEGIEIS